MGKLWQRRIHGSPGRGRAGSPKTWIWCLSRCIPARTAAVAVFLFNRVEKIAVEPAGKGSAFHGIEGAKLGLLLNFIARGF